MTMIGLRKAWFQVHKWIGLVLAVLIIPISLTGSALVWHEPIEKALHPERFAVTGPVKLATGDYADAARGALGEGERLSRIELPGEAGEPVLATGTKSGAGRPQRVTLYLDPATAKVLDTARSGEGVFQVFHMLHGSLMLPGVGRAIVGWVGVAMLIMSLTGLWLWWPLSGSFARGLRWKRHRNTDTNLHHLFGFWISIPLFVLSLTGIWISFPQVFAGFDGAQPRGAGPDRAALARAKPLEAPVQSVDAVVAKALAAAPGKIVTIGWPTDLKPEWSVSVKGAKGPPRSVSVQDGDGSAKAAPPRGPQPQTWARTMRQIHDGGDTPFVWQLIVFLGGILPAALAVTGIIMWWRARKWRGDVAAKRKARA